MSEIPRGFSTLKIRNCLQTVTKKDKHLIEAGDILRIVVLASFTLAIGIYIIATTVLIAEDGAGYIDLARNLHSNPIDIIKQDPPCGYPFLIFLTHKVVTLFSKTTSLYSWIYSAQSVTLLCRLLALIPLYFIGKILIGTRKAFWAILILIILPYPARFGSDVLRDWPHVLFLAWGVLFLLRGVKQGTWWLFAMTGLTAGLGHMVRPECAQLVVYGILWFLISLFLPRHNMGRLRVLCFLCILLIGFAIPVTPYVNVRGRILPKKFHKLFKNQCSSQSDKTQKAIIDNYHDTCVAKVLPGIKLVKAFGRLGEEICDNLMYFFVLPLAIGFYCHFRKIRRILFDERLFILALVILYVVMMVLLYMNYGYMSRRHCMPVVVFTVFYIPAGLRIMARWLSQKTTKDKANAHKDRSWWFFILLMIGVSICAAKFVRIIPLHHDKQGYLKATKWLRENTKQEDIIALNKSDLRIGLYAERTTVRMQTRTSMISAGKVSSGSWYHLAGTFDGNYQKLYINGKLTSSKKISFKALGAGTNSLAIGKPYAGKNSCFKGVIDDVRLYSKALLAKDIKVLYNHQLMKVEKGKLIGHWTLEGDVRDAIGRPNGAMIFNGINDYIDLSHLDLTVNLLDEISVCVWVKPELLNRWNWIFGNGAQFRIGFRNSRAYFWIRERPPGKKIPPKVAYVVAFVENGTDELEKSFNKSIQKKYTVWVNKSEHKKRIAIYKVME